MIHDLYSIKIYFRFEPKTTFRSLVFTSVNILHKYFYQIRRVLITGNAFYFLIKTTGTSWYTYCRRSPKHPLLKCDATAV